MCFLPAVERSTTTSPAFGQLPLTSVSELNRGCEASIEKPRLGAPPKVITLPFDPISCASPPTPPTAASTAGSRLTFASSDSSKDGSTVSDVEEVIAERPVIAASVPR